ncbi:hypothetical protein QFC19_004225 [Naganishia cerealis]|uniref:Uncharacterized protein n=1 Tax=Naganishia cerealis TaxID=610337 RepID=A0ACC2VXQ1_9TREE|nr:hypothetical protein QFC19_004225 [Naganishia cerealis]
MLSNVLAVAKSIDFQGDTHAFLMYIGGGQMETDETCTSAVSGFTGIEGPSENSRTTTPARRRVQSNLDDETLRLSADMKGASTGPGPKPTLNVDELKEGNKP